MALVFDAGVAPPEARTHDSDHFSTLNAKHFPMLYHVVRPYKKG
ncbi:MAG TPA: hypothetical protein VK138_01925 [Acidiferrobacterales bacterium]|nr:hypothetical protein [Acidiferrobacterales bacterium]